MKMHNKLLVNLCYLAGLSLIGVLVLAGCGGAGNVPQDVVMASTPSPEGDGTPAPTLPPEPAGKTVASDGELASAYPKLGLTFEGDISGRLITITVQPGDVVEAGEVLAIIDDTELQRQITEAQTKLDRAVTDRQQAIEDWEQDVADAEQELAGARRELSKAQLQYSDTDLEEARTNLERAQEREKNAEHDYNEAHDHWPPIPIDQYRAAWQHAIQDRELAEMRLADAEDAYNADYLDLQARKDDVAQAEVKLERLQDGIDAEHERAVEDAEDELEKAREALENARLTAPWSAIILSVDISPEAEVDASTSIVTLLNTEGGLRFVTESLSEQHIASVYPGQPAVVTLRTFSETPLEGVIEAVIPQVDKDAEEAEAKFTVRVQLFPTDLRLLPGMTGRVEIYIEE